jgi:hypothetical protein
LIRIEVRQEKPLLDLEKQQKYLERQAKALARVASIEVAKQIPENLNLKKPWIAKGMRYEVLSSSAYESVVVVYHRDYLMQKQGGADFNGHLAVPTEYARGHLSDRRRKPRNVLDDTRAFRDQKGDIWKRLGKTKRKIFFFTRHEHYEDRLHMRDITECVVRQRKGDYLVR